MIRALARFLLLVGLFSASFVALAAGSVRDLQADLKDGLVHVEWEAPGDAADIAFYHVYYSGRSILENNGEYDDYERTTADRREIILTDVPKASGVLFVSVVPVDDDGKEIGAITQEVQVQLTGAASSAAANPAPSVSSSFGLIGAEAVSATEVVLTFSHPVTVPQSEAAAAFRILSAQGQPQQLSRLTIDGATVRIATQPLQNGAYTVQATAVVTGKGAAGERLTFAPGKESLPVRVGQAADPGSGTIADVRNLDMRAERQQNGRYTVIAVWDLPDGSAGVQIQQTRDGAQYAAPQRLPMGATVARFRDVPPGRFGIRVQAISPSGALSTGAVFSLTLAGTPAQSAPLSSSGAGAVGVLTLSGALAGWMRKRKTLHLA